jgi:hypothetical protein
MFTAIYKKLLPLSIRKIIYERFLRNVLYFFRNYSVIINSRKAYYFHWSLPKTEINKAYQFMGKYGITSYPYEYMLEYLQKGIQVFHDAQNGLPFVVHNNQKLYFRKSSSVELVKSDYRALITEQDPRSAHRYVRSYSELNNKILLDVGSAEGILSLDTVNIVNHVYLFEYEDEWMLPLQATFFPWKHKVTIVKKIVGDITSESYITIDDFLRDKTNQNLFIKMDIEGAELRAIYGAMKTFKNGSNIQLAVCTYHRKGDPEIIADAITSLGFQYEFSNGLMYWDKKFSKGIIRGKK